MNKNSVEKVKQEQQYKILIRNLRKQKEEAGRLASKHALSFLYCGACLPG